MMRICAAVVSAWPAVALAASISVSPAEVNAGAQVTVSVHGGAAVGDWVDLVSANTPDGQPSTRWLYLNGKQTQPSTPVADADIRMTAPSTPGDYQARVHLNGSRVVDARTPVTVQGAAKPPSTSGVNSIHCTGTASCPQSTGDVTITGSSLPGPQGDPGPPGQPGPAMCHMGSTVPKQLGDTCWEVKKLPDGTVTAYRGYALPTSDTNQTLMWWYDPLISLQRTPP